MADRPLRPDDPAGTLVYYIDDEGMRVTRRTACAPYLFNKRLQVRLVGVSSSRVASRLTVIDGAAIKPPDLKAARNKRVKLRSIVRGVCFHCKTSPREVGTLCGACSEKNKKKCRARRDALVAAGLCARCGLAKDTPTLVCQVCKSKISAQRAKRRRQ